jgi:undecaprenyl-diphosphatase
MMLNAAKLKLQEMDLRGCLYLNDLSRSERIAMFFKVISRLGDGVFWYAMLLLVWSMQGLSYSLAVAYLVVGSGVGTYLYKVLKRHTVRPRPYQVHQVIRLGERPLDHFSFPSGHTLHAVMISMLLGYAVPMLLLVMLPFSLLVAISRMVLGLHYPTDVIAGAGLGVLVATAVILIAPFINIAL